MTHPFRSIFMLAMLLPTLGCAGGWRNGAAPLGASDRASVTAAPAAQATSATAPGGAAAGATHATADGARFIFAGNASSVNVAGEFNSWSTSADALTKGADGRWTLDKKLAAGRYLYKFVLDGGTWKEDPGAKESADDGFGGKNALLVVGAPGASPAAATPAMTAAPATTGDGAVFRFAGAAGSVALAGEFNSWSTSADPMTKQADGSWSITKALAPGRYMYKFVLDGGTWKEDPGATETADDGFGGKNAVVVVGGKAAPMSAAAPPAAPPAAMRVVTGKPRAPQMAPDGVTFTFAGAARSVSLCGAFNQWALAADPMQQQADGTWTITKRLPAGTHGYKFLVDGLKWKADEANPDGQDDGFGSRNSVVTVK